MLKSGLNFWNDFCASQKHVLLLGKVKSLETVGSTKRMILWHLSIVSATIKKASNTEIQQHLILEHHFVLHMF